MTPSEFSEAVAAEVRAEMARQKRTKVDLAAAINVTPLTASRRVNGAQPFDTADLHAIAAWLGVPVEQFIPRGSVEVPA